MTVSDQIIQVLDHLCMKFGLVIDWTNENVLPYITTLCTKLVTWEIWTSVAWIAFAVLLLVIGIVLTVVSIKKFGELDGLEVFTVLGSILCYIAFIGVTMTQVLDIVTCLTFPEMFVFEYIQGLINSGS